MIAFIQAYTVNGVDYYVVYSDYTVETYDNKGGELRLTGRYANLSGLPIAYKTTNEVNENEGKSELENWISILDSLEDLISKATDAYYRDWETDRKSTRLNSSHSAKSRMPSSA